MSTGLKLTIFGILCMIWGSTWIMIKIGLEGAPPLTAAGIRFIIAAFIIMAIVLGRHIHIPRTSAYVRLTLFLGLFQIGTAYGLVYWAEQHISSGLTAILFSTMPLMVAILARVFLGDPITPWKLGGILLGATGVSVIFARSAAVAGSASTLGVAAALGSAFLASACSVLTKHFARAYNPFATMLPSMSVGGVTLCACGWIFERDAGIRWTTVTVTSIAYLAILGSVVAFGLYFWLIKHIDVTVLSYQTFIIPIVACVLGWIFLGETFTLQVALGAVLIVLGIVLATVPGSRRRRLVGART